MIQSGTNKHSDGVVERNIGNGEYQIRRMEIFIHLGPTIRNSLFATNSMEIESTNHEMR